MKTKEDRIVNTIKKTPSPDRIYAVITQILERRYGVKIEYAITTKSKEAMS